METTQEKCSKCGKELKIIAYSEITGTRLPVWAHVNDAQGKKCWVKRYREENEATSKKFWDKIL